MADAAKQQGFAQGHRGSLDWKRRTATALLGERGVRAVAVRRNDVRARFSDARAWRERTLSSTGRANSAYISQFKNIHLGERCVIVGNGPSLRETDLSLLRHEVTFGLNRIYLMFDELGFQTNYHVVVNQLVVKQCAADFCAIRAPLFTTTPSREHLKRATNTAFLSKLEGPRFSSDVSHGIWEGATVTYVAMQLAYYMGFADVVLVGVDHRFATSGPAHREVESAGADLNHFDPNYFGKGFRWQLPDLDTSELAYSLARAKFDDDGRKIVDATVGGALTVFPKMPLKNALGR